MDTLELIKELCQITNVSQAKLAEGIGLSPQNFSQKLRRDSLSQEEMKHIAQFFGAEYERTFILPSGEWVSTSSKIQKAEDIGAGYTKIRNAFVDLLEGLNDRARGDVEEYVREVSENVATRERDNGIYCAVQSMLDANVDDDAIILSLSRFWNMTYDEAESTLIRTRTFFHPMTKLRRYLRSQGMTEKESNQFFSDNCVAPELRCDHNLWKLSPAELVEELKQRAEEKRGRSKNGK